MHGVRRSEMLVLNRRPGRSVHTSSVSVFTVSRTAGLVAGLGLAALAFFLFAGCHSVKAQKGGAAAVQITRPGHTNSVTLSQSDNPKEPSKQTVRSEQTVEYVLPAGTALWLESGMGTMSGQNLPNNPAVPATKQIGSTTNPHAATAEGRMRAILSGPVPVRCITKDRTETSIGGAQKDTLREWAGKAANMEPVMWAGIIMMTVVAGILVYFGWWTKAAVAVAVGVGMIVVAQTLPDHGAAIILTGLAVFGVVALLVLYAYHKGQLDQNHNGIPDFLERDRETQSLG